MRIFSPSFDNTFTAKGFLISATLEGHLSVARDEFINSPKPKMPINDLSLSALWGAEGSDPDREAFGNVMTNLIRTISNVRTRTEARWREKSFFGLGNKSPRKSCDKKKLEMPPVDYQRTRKATDDEIHILSQIISLIDDKEVISEIRNCNQNVDVLCEIFKTMFERFSK